MAKTMTKKELVKEVTELSYVLLDFVQCEAYLLKTLPLGLGRSQVLSILINAKKLVK